MKTENQKIPTWKEMSGGRKIFTIVFMALFAWLAFSFLKGCYDVVNTPVTTTNTETAQTDKFISGLAPVDVYLSLEKEGFTTTTNSSEYGNSWTSKQSIYGIDYTVETYSTNSNNVISVRATAIIDLTQKKIEATQQFLRYISSLPYDGSNPQEAGKWLVDNFNTDKATTTIGGAKFTLSAPSVALRMLTIEKAN